MSKVIIGIHGLGNKPSKIILEDWWKKSILEGLKKHKYSKSDFNFELVYWTDVFYPTQLNHEEVNKSNPYYLKDPYLPEDNSIAANGFREKAMEYLEKFYGKIVVNGVLSLKYPSLTDLFFRMNMREIENYYSPFYIDNNGSPPRLAREVLIERLSETINKHKGKKILLISHSMGSIISHDCLLENMPKLEIDTLISIGSPLGQKYVLNKMLDGQKTNQENKLRVPENIKSNWYNLSDIEDHVSLNHLLAELYVPNSKGVKIIDKLVHNTYKHDSMLNPHSSYGYLRTPELAEIVHAFLTPKIFRFFNWFKVSRKKV
jgi:hypothetical protein